MDRTRLKSIDYKIIIAVLRSRRKISVKKIQIVYSNWSFYNNKKVWHIASRREFETMRETICLQKMEYSSSQQIFGLFLGIYVNLTNPIYAINLVNMSQMYRWLKNNCIRAFQLKSTAGCTPVSWVIGEPHGTKVREVK